MGRGVREGGSESGREGVYKVAETYYITQLQ